jgi:hypothetical protein
MKRITFLLIIVTFSASAWALPPEIEMDRLLLQAKSALDNKDYALATVSLMKAEKLSVKTPDTFYYHYGIANAGNGKFEQGREMLEKYLTLSGTKGKFYKEALVEINNIELFIVKRDTENLAAIKKRDADNLAAIKEKEAELESAREARAKQAREEQAQRERDKEAFSSCASDALRIKREGQSYNEDLKSAQLREIAGHNIANLAARLRKEERRLDKSTESFRSRCTQEVYLKVDDDFKQSVCDHPAYRSPWCQND